MTLKISSECGELLARQDGVIGRTQALEFGLSSHSRAIGGRLTTAARLRLALTKRKRFSDRPEAESALRDAGQGALSNLERWYLRGVERRHMLPVPIRQARIKVGGGSIYLDNLYEEYLVCVELDGAAAHPAGEQWGDNGGTGGTSPSRRSSPCALDTWTFARRKRGAEPRPGARC